MATLEGTAELAAALRALPGDVSNKVLRKSAIAGARVVRDAVKSLAPVSGGLKRRSSGKLTPPGTLRRAVVLKFAKEKSGSEAATYVVTVRRGKSAQKSNRDAFYFSWVERGHRIAHVRGVYTGEVAPHPFFVPAYRASAATARAKMKAAMESEMGAIIRADTFARVSARAKGA